jgi:hypothetical protein
MSMTFQCPASRGKKWKEKKMPYAENIVVTAHFIDFQANYKNCFKNQISLKRLQYEKTSDKSQDK